MWRRSRKKNPKISKLEHYFRGCIPHKILFFNSHRICALHHVYYMFIIGVQSAFALLLALVFLIEHTSSLLGEFAFPFLNLFCPMLFCKDTEGFLFPESGRNGLIKMSVPRVEVTSIFIVCSNQPQ